MLATRRFEQPRLSPDDVRIAVGSVKWKRLKLLPRPRTTVVEEPHAASAWAPSRNFTPSATSTGPKARAIAAGALCARRRALQARRARLKSLAIGRSSKSRTISLPHVVKRVEERCTTEDEVCPSPAELDTQSSLRILERANGLGLRFRGVLSKGRRGGRISETLEGRRGADRWTTSRNPDSASQGDSEPHALLWHETKGENYRDLLTRLSTALAMTEAAYLDARRLRGL